MHLFSLQVKAYKPRNQPANLKQRHHDITTMETIQPQSSLPIKGFSVLELLLIAQKPTPDLVQFPTLTLSHSHRKKKGVETLHTPSFQKAGCLHRWVKWEGFLSSSVIGSSSYPSTADSFLGNLSVCQVSSPHTHRLL